MWDTEVDVACIGGGFGGLATAIATVDAGGEVLVVDAAPASYVAESGSGPLRERLRARHSWLTLDTRDTETDEYLAAVVEGVTEVASSSPDVPVRTARNLSREEAHGRFVEPFVGARLIDWASTCVSSPYGLMYTSMRDRSSTPMRSAEGDAIEVCSIGAVEWAAGSGESALRQWLSDQARQRDIEAHTATTLQRVVFEDGVIVGVVLATPQGPHAVRVRAGIAFSPRDEEPSISVPADHASTDRLQVCLVGRAASRFGRVELMATEPTAAPRPTCTGSRRQFREGLHDSRQPALEAWRCGKAYGYPPLGQ